MVESIYQDLVDDMTWSYSRLKCFEDCPYRWYLKYIIKEEEKPLFYSTYGSFMHMILQEYYSGEIEQDYLFWEFLTNYRHFVASPPTEKIAESYVNKGAEYIRNFQPLPYETLEVEMKTEFKLDEWNFVGIIDHLARDEEGNIYLIDNKSRDLKPRSKRKTPTVKDQELDAMLKQLYIYSIPVKEKYGKYPEYLCFNCFKAQTFIKEPFNKQAFENALNWARQTIKEIRTTEFFRPNIDYFPCRFICGVHDECCYYEGKE